MRLSHEHKLLLISNWKCGCSTIAEMFASITEFDWNTRDRCQRFFGKDYNTMVHYPVGLMRQEFLREGFLFDEYAVISSVRNPWSRAVSLYEHVKRVGWNGSFDAFVEKELPAWRSGQINRWNTYEMFHEQGDCLIDCIVRIEHLETDLRPFAEERWPSLQLDYATMSNTSKHKPYEQYYENDVTRRRVEEFFRYDIEAFDYCFDDALAK